MGTENNCTVINNGICCEAKTVPECGSWQCKAAGRGGSVVALLPVLISKCKINISMNNRLKFDRYIVDITGCRRYFKLGSCRLLNAGAGHGSLFLGGHIVESIEYIDAGCSEGREFSGVLRFLSLEVPFECNTRIVYSQSPFLKKNNGFYNIVISKSGMTCNESADECKMSCEIENAEISGSINRCSTPLDSGIFNEAVECISVDLNLMLLQKQLVNIY